MCANARGGGHGAYRHGRHSSCPRRTSCRAPNRSRPRGPTLRATTAACQCPRTRHEQGHGLVRLGTHLAHLLAQHFATANVAGAEHLRDARNVRLAHGAALLSARSYAPRYARCTMHGRASLLCELLPKSWAHGGARLSERAARTTEHQRRHQNEAHAQQDDLHGGNRLLLLLLLVSCT